jgi:hypothetical protein
LLQQYFDFELCIDFDISTQSTLGAGASAYSKPEDDDNNDLYGDNSAGQPAFKITPYEKPQTPGHVSSYNVRGVGAARPSYAVGGVTPPPGGGGGTTMQQPQQSKAPVGANAAWSLNTRSVANVWGKRGVTAAVADFRG